MNPELSSALLGVAIAALGSVTAVVVALGTYGSQYIRKLLEVRAAELEHARSAQLARAGETAAAAVEEVSRTTGVRGEEKADLAKRITIDLMQVPPVTSPHDSRVADVVRAGVTKLRASMPHPTTYSLSAAELGAVIKAASVAPPPLAGNITAAERPSSKRGPNG